MTSDEGTQNLSTQANDVTEHDDLGMRESTAEAFAMTGDPNGMRSKVYMQKYKLNKATKNGCQVKAVDAETNSQGYINLHDHPLGYLYIGDSILDDLRDAVGHIPIEFSIELRATAWTE